MKLRAFGGTTPSHVALGSARRSPEPWGRGSRALFAFLASGECDLLPGGNHLPILHLLHDGADLAGGCHDCRRKAEGRYSGGRKERNVLTHYQMLHGLFTPSPWQLLSEQVCLLEMYVNRFLPSLPECEDIAEEYWEEMLQEKEKTKDKLGTNCFCCCCNTGSGSGRRKTEKADRGC